MGSADLPTGTVTFLFTDIEGSTRRLQELGEGYRRLQEDHDAILRGAIAKAGGTTVRTEGDSFFAAFPTASGAIEAAVSAQRSIQDHEWPGKEPVRVRMGLHTGEGALAGDDYMGLDVNRTARIAAAGHGGQVLVSEATRGLSDRALPGGVELRDLGPHRLKDLATPEHIFQLVIEGLESEFPPLRSLETHPNNLPTQVSTFVGRTEAIARLAGLLEGRRLVTLTGPGGTGKTRLALEVARKALDQFRDGAFFVPLAAITDPDLVASAVLGALGLRQSTVPPEERLAEYLSDLELLLVLDNFEQVLDAGTLVARLLGAAPRLHVLVTSRAPLRIYGEQEIPVDPLTVPDPEVQHPASAAAGFESVALFVDRARAVDPTFSLNESNSAGVIAIVSALEGLPLAIELAAARVRVLSVDAIVDRLGSPLALLSGGPRDVPARQQTLRAAITWSYQLLPQSAKSLFRRLAPFNGGFDMDQVESVCNIEQDFGVPSMADLELLVDQSLLRRTGPEPRFRMLETVREFARERLFEEGEAEHVEMSHASAYLALAEEAAPRLVGPDRSRWLDRLEQDHDNLRVAFTWALEAREASVADRLLWALWRFWQIRGYLYEGRRLADATLALPATDARLRCRAYEAAGGIAYWKAEFEDCFKWYAAALELARQIGDPELVADALYNSGFGMVFPPEADPAAVAAAEAMLVEAFEIYRELGDRVGEARVSWARATLVWSLPDHGSLARAVDFYRESADIFQEVGDVFQYGWAERMLSRVLLELDRTDEAVGHIRAAMDVFLPARDVSALTLLLLDLSILALKNGDEDQALRLQGAIEAMRKTTGIEMADFRTNRSVDIDALLLSRGASAKPLLDEGAAMSFDEVVAYALEGLED
jgi:predicted ATPase/class 3 adenylate cyclase